MSEADKVLGDLVANEERVGRALLDSISGQITMNAIHRIESELEELLGLGVAERMGVIEALPAWDSIQAVIRSVIIGACSVRGESE